MQYKKSLISATFALGTLLVGHAQAEWKYNTEVFFAAGDDASVHGIRWLQPWWQDGKAMAYTDLRVLKSDKNTDEINLGGGFRQMNSDDSAIWGGYGFLDYRKSTTNRAYTQLTLGGEYLLDKWEFRSNFYLPLKDEYIVDSLNDQYSFEDEFTGTTVTRITTIVPGEIVVEEALQGYDVEAGYLLPGSEDFEIRANLGIYQYSAAVAGSTQGLRARIEAFPRESFKVGFSIESDELFGTRSFLELSLPLGRKIGRPGKRSLHKRMTQFAYRDIDVRETSRVKKNKRTRASTQATDISEPEILEANVLHIDSNTGVDPAAADGSIELPFQSIAECMLTACSTPELDTVFYLHADANASNNGNAQHYIGNLVLSDGQKIVGDGATRGNFVNLSTGVSPILLGEEFVTDPILSLSGGSQVAGLQLGWDHLETLPGSDTSTFVAMPTGAGMPDEAIRITNQGGQSNDIALFDLSITGASAIGLDDTMINSTNNFATGIHFLSDSATSTENILAIERLTANFVLGDAVHAELYSPNIDTFNSQSMVITSSTIAKNGRGIHATVDGVAGGLGEQIVSIRLPNAERNSETNTVTDNLGDLAGFTPPNVIEFNLNEGILLENLATDNYAADLAANLADNDANPLTNPTPFLATQNLFVRNALIQNNQGAGIQAHFGAINTSNSSNSSLETATVKLEDVSLYLNEGSGLVLSSVSSDLEVELKNTTIGGNIPYSVSEGFGSRLDGAAIDCDTSTTGGNLAVAGCGDTNASNDNRTSADFLHTGYGIYARNEDTTGSLSTQTITISENFQVFLHDENSAQIFLESVGLVEDASSQTLDIQDDTEFAQLIGGGAGEIQTIGSSYTVGSRQGVSIEGVAYCDEDTRPSAVDNDAPHITFSGPIDEAGSTEICQ